MPSPSKQSKQPLKVLKKYFGTNNYNCKINKIINQAIKILRDNNVPTDELVTSPNLEINNISQEHLEHIKALNQLAIIATTRPYSAVLEYIDKNGVSKIFVSPATKINQENFKKSYELFLNYHEDPNPTNKYHLYEHLYKIKHPYINSLLYEYKSFFIANNEDNVTIQQVQKLMDQFLSSEVLDDTDVLDRFKQFVIWCNNDKNIFSPTEYTKKLVQKYDFTKDITILPYLGNVPHVEMYGISEITKTIKHKSSEILKINIGLAPNNRYPPSTCAGCTAEIEAIRHDGVQAFVYAYSPYNIPEENKYKLSNNVLNSKNPNVWKSVLESKYLNKLQGQIDFLIDKLTSLPEAEDLLNQLSNIKQDIGEAIEGAIDAYNELHPEDIDSLTDSLEKITTKTVAACGSKQKRSIDPCTKFKPLYQPLPDHEHIINQYLDYAFMVETRQGRNLKYMTNLSKLLDETKENYSKVEQGKLDLLFRKASNFRKKYIDENSLKAISKQDFPKQLPALYSNGEHTILLFKENNQYKLYSKSINYNKIFTLKADLAYPELSSFIEQFFSVNSINPHYNCYVLTNPLPEKAINQLNLNPNQISTDYQKLAKGKVPGIKNFSEKEILDLSGYNFQNRDIKQLTKINLNKVRTLILDNNNIGIKGLEAILYSGNFPNLKELSIRNNKLDIKDASSLINLNKLPILDISQNKFSLQAIERFSLLENSKIQIVTGKDYDQLKYQIGHYGGYDKYLESVHIQEIMSNMHSKQYGKALGNKLLNAAGHIQLINSLHSISQTCVQDDATKECMLGLAGFSYSFLSQPIENIAIKYTVKSLNNAGNIASKFSRFKSIKPEFIIKVGAGKYAVKFAKGAAGAIAGAFDIVDITLASVKLNECLSTIDNKCSDKEIRDSIASITFASISFISGIVFIANPIAGIVVGTGLMIGQGVYNGVSNIVEYEEKYDTTHGENWSIFWHSFLSIPMHRDITELAARKEYIDQLTEQAFANFQALSNNTDIVAYGFGLGEVHLRTIKKIVQLKETFNIRGDRVPARDIEVEETNTKLCSSSSVIDMSKPHNKKYSLSRFLPKKVPQTDIICLPKKTNNNYEYSEESSNSEDSKYYCENAAVMQSQANSFSKNPSIIYDLGYINSGRIIGSNKWNNIFYIYESNSELRGGENITNHFVFLGKNFTGRIKFAYNSTNIIDTSKLSNENIKISWNSTVPISGLMNIRFANEKSTIWAEQIDEKIKINIYGSSNNTNTVICNTEDVASKSKLQSPILVNTGGANNPFYFDKIKNCNDVVVYPNTNVSGEVGKYLFYIKTNEFGNYNTKSEIDVKGNVTVTFPDIVLLKDCQKIYYSKEDDILYFDISPWSSNKVFTLKLKNYQNNNYTLFDKYGTHVVPKLSDNEIVNRFELNARYPNQDDKRIVQELQNLSQYQKYFKKITSSKEGYKILTVMEIPFFSPDIEDYNKILQLDSDNKKNIILGSSGKDIINLNKQVIYAQGNEKSDIYIAEFLLGYSKFYINNKATDQELDVLYIPYGISSMEIANISNSLKLKITNQEQSSIKIIDILDYFKGTEYQHLMLLDQEYNGFIPFNTSKTGLILAPFYRASNTKNVFLVSSDTKLAVIEDTNYEIYRKDYDLIFLTTNKLVDLQASIVLKDFYSDHKSWKNFKLYKYNKAIDYKNPIELPNINQDILTLDHKNLNSSDIFTVYNFDFTHDEEIFHNIEDIYTDPYPTPEENKKIGIVRFWNINPKDITVERQNEDIVLKHVNGYELIISKVYSDTYASHINIFEFWGLEGLLEPIIIYHNSDYSFQFQLLQAGMMYEAFININKLGNKANCVDINELKYLIALENIKDVSTAKALGFASLLEQMQYLQNYNLIPNDLIKLKDCINDKLLSQYKFILHESLPLKPSSKEKVAEYREVIEQIPFSSTSVIEFIDNLIQEVDNIIPRTARHIRHNNYHKTEFNVDEASYRAESLSSGATRGNSWINNGVKVIKSLFVTLLQNPLLSDNSYKIISLEEKNTSSEYRSTGSNIGKLDSGANNNKVPLLTINNENCIETINKQQDNSANIYNIAIDKQHAFINYNANTDIAIPLSSSIIIAEDNYIQYNLYNGCPEVDAPFKQDIVSDVNGSNAAHVVIRSYSFGSCADIYHNIHIEELPVWANSCRKPKTLLEILSIPHNKNNSNGVDMLNQSTTTMVQLGNSFEMVKNTLVFLGNDNPSLVAAIPITGTTIYLAALLPSLNPYNFPIHLISSITSSVGDYMKDKSYTNVALVMGKMALLGLSAVNPLAQLAFSVYAIGDAIYSKLPHDSSAKLTIACGGTAAIIGATNNICSVIDANKEIIDMSKGLTNLQSFSTILNVCRTVSSYLESSHNDTSDQYEYKDHNNIENPLSYSHWTEIIGNID